MSGNTSELGDICKSSGKSSLFFLTFLARISCISKDPGISLPGDRVHVNGKARLFFDASGALLTVLEKPSESLVSSGTSLFAPLVVLITASGLQGMKPLVI